MACTRMAKSTLRYTSLVIGQGKVSDTFQLLLAYLEATCEELQARAKLSAVEQALEGTQTLQSHLALLESQ